MTTTNDYTKAAADFAAKHGISLKVGTPTYGKHFAGDTQSRYIFPCTLKRGGKSYSFKFGQSINAGRKEPSFYDILATLQKSDPEDYHNFCQEFGYDEYNEISGKINKQNQRLYLAVVREWEGVNNLFGDILDELREIN